MKDTIAFLEVRLRILQIEKFLRGLRVKVVLKEVRERNLEVLFSYEIFFLKELQVNVERLISLKLTSQTVMQNIP